MRCPISVLLAMAIGSVVPEGAVAQDNTDSGGGDISDFSRDAAVPESPPPPPPLPPTFRLLGAYQEPEQVRKPGKVKRGFGITAIVIGTPTLIAGIVAAGVKWSVEKDRDEKYPPEVPDYSLTPEQKQGIADYDEKIRRYQILGWTLVGSGLGLCIIGSLLVALSSDNARGTGSRSRKGGSSLALNGSAFGLAGFSDGRTTAVTMQIQW